MLPLPDAIAVKLLHLPESPGVYLWKSLEGEVLYVGKAKRLRSRVRSYFTNDQGASLNVNADSAAAALAGALHASKLILLTETDGVLERREDPGSLISRLSPEAARAMIADGRADKGMVPKQIGRAHV